MKNIVRFKPSSSGDVIEYRARILKSPFSYDAAYSIVYPSIDNVLDLKPGENVYITAADSFNESNPLKLENIMARVGKRTLRFTPSASADATGYRIRIIKDGLNFGYDLPYDEITDPKDGQKIEVDIGSLSVAPSEEGVYDTFVTALDGFGNESDPMVIENSRFDFVAPEAPTEGEIV